MPTYEYKCFSCGYSYEKKQSIKARPERKCPKCGKRITRLPGVGSCVIFKGTGFYCNDYGRKKNESHTNTK